MALGHRFMCFGKQSLESELFKAAGKCTYGVFNNSGGNVKKRPKPFFYLPGLLILL